MPIGKPADKDHPPKEDGAIVYREVCKLGCDGVISEREMLIEETPSCASMLSLLRPIPAAGVLLSTRG